MARNITHTGGGTEPRYTGRDIRCVVHAIRDVARKGGGIVMLEIKPNGTVYLTPYKKIGRSIRAESNISVENEVNSSEGPE